MTLDNVKVSPRVKFAGRKPDFKKELRLDFGDYCECYNPAVVRTVHSTLPSGKFLRLIMVPEPEVQVHKKRVRRSNWSKMVTDLVINAMNAYSESEADAAIEEDEVREPVTNEQQGTGEEQEEQTPHEDDELVHVKEQHEAYDQIDHHQETQQKELTEVDTHLPRRSARV